jgi:hypothetical protein
MIHKKIRIALIQTASGMSKEANIKKTIENIEKSRKRLCKADK